jgi:hypothetical protein
LHPTTKKTSTFNLEVKFNLGSRFQTVINKQIALRGQKTRFLSIKSAKDESACAQVATN